MAPSFEWDGYIDAINAANGKLLSKIARGGKEEVDLAVKAANEAFKGWSNTPIEERSALLHKVADLLEANQDRLKIIECMDIGRAIHEFDLDYQLAIYQFRYFASANSSHSFRRALKRVPRAFPSMYRNTTEIFFGDNLTSKNHGFASGEAVFCCMQEVYPFRKKYTHLV